MSQNLTEQDFLAIRVVDLAKALVLADNHFLSSAVGRLPVQPGLFGRPFASNGYVLGINSQLLLLDYVDTGEPPKYAFLHSVLHCVFLHPFVGPSVDRRLWNLACDIAVEKTILEIYGSAYNARALEIEKVLPQIVSKCDGLASAEKIYSLLRSGSWAKKVDQWEALFMSDDHSLWYASDGGSSGSSNSETENTTDAGGDQSQNQSDSSNQNQSDSSGGADDNSGQDDVDSNVNGSTDKSSNQRDSGSSGASTDDAGSGKNESDNSEDNPQDNHDDDPKRDQGRGAGSDEVQIEIKERGFELKQVKRATQEEAKETWRRVAKTLAVDLQTLSKKRSAKLGSFIDDLELASRQHVDYKDFLRQFAIPGEIMKLSDDEFDYNFYTYGLKLYGNVPLIEPLEYREEKLIREFVIALDTSGSVQGELIKRFIDVTFDILKSTEAFFEHVHIRIIQCDDAVQSDDKITNLKELKEWGQHFKIYGCGGTSFVPVFDYVDTLIENGEFENLGGLIYFTDGWGDYPEKMPEYKTAFIFYDNDYKPAEVPPWAIQVVLGDQEILDS